MYTDREPGTPGGGTIPDHGQSDGGRLGGMSISDSTVGGAGDSARTVIGQGSTGDRGSLTNEEADTSTSQARELEYQERGEVPTRIAERKPGTQSPGQND